MSPWYWLAILVVLVLVEIFTVALTTIWFAGGAFAALLTSCFTDNIILECVLFAVVSLALLFFLRPSVVRRFNKRRAKTNVEAEAGKTVNVIEAVDNAAGTGRVTVRGMEWAARSNRDEVTFSVGDKATVIRVEGVKLIIDKEE